MEKAKVRVYANQRYQKEEEKKSGVKKKSSSRSAVQTRLKGSRTPICVQVETAKKKRPEELDPKMNRICPYSSAYSSAAQCSHEKYGRRRLNQSAFCNQLRFCTSRVVPCPITPRLVIRSKRLTQVSWVMFLPVFLRVRIGILWYSSIDYGISCWRQLLDDM